MFVAVGGINQWITIRGQNRDNPVVLFLHGGPGTPTNLLDFPFAKAWTPTFTLVQWDQRGAGTTFGSGGTAATDMTIDYLLEIEPLDTGDARLKLRDGTLVGCSRTYRDALRGRF